jgi:hypothetical protein
LIEVPVTTMPVLRVPIHLSYLLYLQNFGNFLPLLYFRFALALCRLGRLGPSLLLHPLDFLGRDDEEDLAFFPAMNLTSDRKLELVRRALLIYKRHFRVVSMRRHAEEAAAKRSLRAVEPVFASA